ncbi:MAG: hypothetical protein AB7E42_05180 [Anaerotignaceae bacterium]
MKRKIFLILLTLFYILYAYAISTNNNIIGDILSPLLLLIISGIISPRFIAKMDIFAVLRL